ncbi:MAG: STAS domain-containing protein [Candidatus Accumulibacter sp. UW26]|jgi:rsbT co-antagonist protein RsbR
MTIKLLAPLDDLLTEDRTAIVEQWLAEVIRLWSQHYPGLVRVDEIKHHASHFLDQLTGIFAAHSGNEPPDIAATSALAASARALSVQRTKAGFKPADTAQYVLALKNVLTGRIIRRLSASPENMAACLTAVNDVLDRLSLLTFEAYVETRERIIAQQSVSLMELSTPVIRLWDQVLMLPLVGVIDTLRARQFTERLLESISRYEATVTVIDVTGVPVFDTSVARHIMKSIDAAQLLGTRVVMTGISAEGAQTLTKLGLSFAGVISRASLRAGLAEALKIVGRRVVAINGSNP